MVPKEFSQAVLLSFFPELTGHGGKSLTLGCGIVEPSVPGICFCLSIVGSCPTPRTWPGCCMVSIGMPTPSRNFLSFRLEQTERSIFPSRPPVCPPAGLAWLHVSPCIMFSFSPSERCVDLAYSRTDANFSSTGWSISCGLLNREVVVEHPSWGSQSLRNRPSYQ